MKCAKTIKLPEFESIISEGNGTISPIWPKAWIATEASAAVSLLATSTRHFSVLWNSVSGIYRNMNVQQNDISKLWAKKMNQNKTLVNCEESQLK